MLPSFYTCEQLICIKLKWNNNIELSSYAKHKTFPKLCFKIYNLLLLSSNKSIHFSYIIKKSFRFAAKKNIYFYFQFGNPLFWCIIVLFWNDERIRTWNILFPESLFYKKKQDTSKDSSDRFFYTRNFIGIPYIY